MADDNSALGVTVCRGGCTEGAAVESTSGRVVYRRSTHARGCVCHRSRALVTEPLPTVPSALPGDGGGISTNSVLFSCRLTSTITDTLLLNMCFVFTRSPSSSTGCGCYAEAKGRCFFARVIRYILGMPKPPTGSTSLPYYAMIT
jgi:hypothetical protein